MSEIAAADIYEVLKIVGTGWKCFARTKLGLTEADIEECEYGRNDLKEVRFQMVQTWMRKEGRRATTERLYRMTDNQSPPRQQLCQGPNYHEKYTEQGASNNWQGISMTAPVDDVSIPKGQLETEDRDQTRRDMNRGAFGMDKDIAPSKTFGNEKSREKHHRRSESESSHSVQSENCGSADSMAKPKGKSKIKKVANQLTAIFKRTKLKETPKAFSADRESHHDICDTVHWDKVKPVTDEDRKLILQQTNRYPTELNRGCALILNNSFLRDKDLIREGAEKDVANMQELWGQIGCDIYGGVAQQEKTADEIKQLLRKMTVLKKRYGYIVVVIMTHGQSIDGNVMFKGSDSHDVSVEDIETIFNNKNAPQLIDVPKFFIFQFCCGTKVDRGVDTDYSNIQRAFERVTSVDTPTKHTIVRADGGKVPTSSDMHFAYATHKEHAALRSPANGSWFITAITNVFMEYSRCEDVHTMLLRVHGAMKGKFGLYEDENERTTYCVNAMSWSGGSFTKRLFLLPGFHKR